MALLDFDDFGGACFDHAVMSVLFSLREAASILGISVDQVRGFIQDGELSYINVGRGKKRPTFRFTQSDLDEFVERRRKREVPFVPFRMGKTNVTVRKRRRAKKLGPES